MTKKQLGEFIRSQRELQQVSQQELSTKIKRRRQAVYEIEENRVDFRVSVLLDMLGALGYVVNLIPLPSKKLRPVVTVGIDFSKIAAAKPDQSIGPFKKKNKNNEKSNRRTRS